MKEITKGNRADALMNDPIMQEAMESVRLALLQKIEYSPLRDTEGVQECRLMLKLLRDLKANLTIFINNGKLAELKVEQDKKLKYVR